MTEADAIAHAKLIIDHWMRGLGSKSLTECVAEFLLERQKQRELLLVVGDRLLGCVQLLGKRAGAGRWDGTEHDTPAE